jgi:hypothetical protein
MMMMMMSFTNIIAKCIVCCCVEDLKKEWTHGSTTARPIYVDHGSGQIGDHDLPIYQFVEL